MTSNVVTAEKIVNKQKSLKIRGLSGQCLHFHKGNPYTCMFMIS
jgi:hypothetical protein